MNNNKSNNQIVKNFSDTPDEGYLNSLFERIERLEEEKKYLSADISSIFSEAKGKGYDVKAMRQVLKKRRLSKPDREVLEFNVAEYMKKLGM